MHCWNKLEERSERKRKKKKKKKKVEQRKIIIFLLKFDLIFIQFFIFNFSFLLQFFFFSLSFQDLFCRISATESLHLSSKILSFVKKEQKEPKEVEKEQKRKERKKITAQSRFCSNSAISASRPVSSCHGILGMSPSRYTKSQ